VVALVERQFELETVAQVLAGGGVLVIEGGAGIGKSALLDEACGQAAERGGDVVRARGSELEAGFAFGVVRQLFERRVAVEDAAALDGPAAAATRLLRGDAPHPASSDTSFAVIHGLYWVVANLAAQRPLLIAVDDAHWADAASLRWMAYLAPRLEGLPVALVVALRPVATGLAEPPLAAVREAGTIVHPRPLSDAAVAGIAHGVLGATATDSLCRSVYAASGGNPFLAHELVAAIERDGPAATGGLAPAREDVARRVVARVVGFDPRALALARAAAVLGDGHELREAAAIGRLPVDEAHTLASALVRLDVLLPGDRLSIAHPLVREALEASMASAERDAAHLAAARMLHAERAPPGQIAAHLVHLLPTGDAWVVERLREAAHAALASGTPASAADLLRRTLSEPPAAADRVAVLREAARAEASAGQETAAPLLEEALGLSRDRRERAEIALAVAETHAAFFRWVDAVDVLERALEELGDADATLAARLEGELVVSGLHDARRAGRARETLGRLASRGARGPAAEAQAVAAGMLSFLIGRPAEETAAPLERALATAGPETENWDTRAALLWVLVATERFEVVAAALEPMRTEVQRSGSARGLVAVYSTLGLLHLRLGALPDADATARVALRVLQEGDFAPGLGFAATVLADVAIEAGELEEAQALLDLLPGGGWPAGVATVLIPAARGRLRLAQGRAGEAVVEFDACMALFESEAWGVRTRETGYVHARSGAALALLRVGEHERARKLAEAELADVERLGTPRAIGVARRAAGLAHGGAYGRELLRESVVALRASPAVLERAHSLAELGAALRRGGERAAARDPLAEALDLAARCGARPLAARAREELRATGARPRRAWRTGVEALTPSELRVARLAAEERTNREIAYELYVTLKTVEGHLGRVYAKLGIAGRPELAAALDAKTRVRTP